MLVSVHISFPEATCLISLSAIAADEGEPGESRGGAEVRHRVEDLPGVDLGDDVALQKVSGCGRDGEGHQKLADVGERREEPVLRNDTWSVLPDCKIWSLPFLGLYQGEAVGAQSKERKGSKFAAQHCRAIVQKPERPSTYDLKNCL